MFHKTGLISSGAAKIIQGDRRTKLVLCGVGKGSLDGICFIVRESNFLCAVLIFVVWERKSLEMIGRLPCSAERLAE